MSNYRPYPKYKDSGVEWLGDVPEHWVQKAIKWESNVARGASPRPIEDPIYFDDDGEYAWVRISDVTSAGRFLESTTQRLSALGSSLSVKLQPGALFLSIAGSVGKPCLTMMKCCIHDGFVHFPSWKSNVDFLYYIFASGEPYKGLGKFGTQLNLNTDTVGGIQIALPPLPEQIQIATFLDRECGKLDALQAKQERLIALLKEKRQALISHAVTKGLDPNVKLKPSGIEWLGDVPVGWVVPYFGMLIGKAVLGGNYDGSEGGDGIPLIKMGNLDRGFIKTHKVEYLPEGQAYDRAYILRNGDFLFNTRNSLDLVGKVAVWRSELPQAIYNSNILRITFRKQKVGDSVYMSYFFNSDLGVSQLRLVAKGTTSVAAIYYKDLTTLRIPLPPLAEQRAIVAHLDEKCGKIDQLMTKAERAIALLKERRSALISAAVTGKIDVRDVAADCIRPAQLSKTRHGG